MVARALLGGLRKASTYAVVAWVALTLNFALPRLAPGDPLDYLLGEEASIIPAAKREAVMAQFGLDRPVTEQYRDYLAGAVRGDFGTSVRTGRSVTETLVPAALWTALLVAPAIVVSNIAGVVLGALAAWRRGRSLDVGLMTGMLVLESMPGFWIALLLLSVFVAQLGWLPSFGIVPLDAAAGGLDLVVEVGRRLILPVATITLANVGNVFLLTRATLLTTLGEDYLTMAEAKGASPARMMFHHALRNALLPVHTHFVLSLGFMLSGAVVVETVFSYPGIGRTVFESVLARDYPLLQGAFLITTFGVILANLLADVTYPLVDPRVRRPSGAV